MKTLATAIAALALAASPMLAADATGKWEAALPGPQGEMAFVFDLSADGEKLTGKVSNELMGDSEIKDGTISGAEISFKHELERGPRVITFSYSGKIKGDEMELTRRVEAAGGGKKGGQRPPRDGERPGGGGRGGMGREITFTAKRM